ncbi:MAG: MarR family transcriptional regulator, partial [Blastococcus sp.]|nr:MarR family transcriptional regulator [Blastococcus sp.]
MSTTDDVAETAPDALQLENQVCFALSVAARNVVAVYR